MIITLTKADFSSCKIGTLTTFNVRKSTVIGASVNITKTSVERAGYTSHTTIATIVLDESNYEGHAIKVMMGSTDVSLWYAAGNVIIPAHTPITSNITISVSATAVSGGSEPSTPTMYTFTINPTPTTATVTLTASGYSQSGNAITVPSGTTVSWIVSADGYYDKNGSETVTKDKTLNVRLAEVVNPGETVQLNSSNTNTSYNDTANHLNSNVVAGQSLPKSSVGTKGILGWDIPQYAIVTLTVSGGGNYGMAITDNNDIVIEGFTNSSVATDATSQGVYTFSPVTSPARLYVSTTKFVSASYTIINEEDLKQYDFNVRMEYTSEGGQFIGTTQTVGSDVTFADMNGTYYMISAEIPSNTVTTLNVKSGGNYGMCIADLNGKVLESKSSNTADDNGDIVFSEQTVPYKLWVSKTKYNNAKYKFI